MLLQKHTLPYLIGVLSLSLCCSCIIHDEDDHLSRGYDSQEEVGYDFRAYPSYFNLDQGVEFDNSSIEFDGKLSGFEEFKRDTTSSSTAYKTINVLNYGAKGDGHTDDSKVFLNAWKEACSSMYGVNFVIPRGRSYFLKPIRFTGPCKSHIITQISGTLIASNDRSDYSKDGRHWIVFDSVQNLQVEGGGTIDGNGNIWWQNSCKINKAKPCKDAPTALTFLKCGNLVVNNLKIQNAQQIHMSFEKCTNVEASNLVVNAPEKSPNTDGIHVTATQNIRISSCTIGTGDDCISIVSGSARIQATGITCGPGHGISIGSLGARNSEDHVSDVVVNGAKLSGTTNGVRIKTWQGGSGSASNIKFQNVEMHNVKNPIIIDQNYCDQDGPCKQQASAVQVKNVVYQNIQGTSASNVAIDFDCSKSHPCQGIVLQNVDLAGNGGGKAKAVCNNVNLQKYGTVTPSCP
ncbi:polygalacturonase-like [Primulina tabacum]|uniref:polygalacturonase-like n=1 Tax=Primulina tabacum TaxID=48773 RepID=UPI003F5AB436